MTTINRTHAVIKLALSCFTALVCTAVSAAQSQDYTYTLTNGTVTITRYTGPGGDVTIPSNLNGVPVRALANEAFTDCTNLTSITIPDSVVVIEDGYRGSWGTSDVGAFSRCLNLTTASIGHGVTNIGGYTFAECGRLTTVTIGASVKTISFAAFVNCPALTELNVAAVNANFSSLNGVLFNADRNTLVKYPVGRPDPVYIVPESVQTIGDFAFYPGCPDLAAVTLGNRVTNIATGAFLGCPQLGHIRIPDSVTQVERAAFRDCTALTNVSFGHGLTSIGDDAFAECSQLTQVAIPDNVLSLGGAFSGCRSLTNVIIGNGVTMITGRSCGSCGGFGCPPSTSGTFTDCSRLTSVVLGNSVTNIQTGAFTRCDSLTSVTVPASVTILEIGAFLYCPKLTGVFFQGHAPAVVERCDPHYQETNAFVGSSKVVVYYLPGKTGWGSTFSGRKAALWNPVFDTGNPAFGVHATGFGLLIKGTADLPMVLEATTDLRAVAWAPLLSGTLTNGSVEFRDPEWTSNLKRFYRIRSP